jgi:hypothetical protein
VRSFRSHRSASTLRFRARSLLSRMRRIDVAGALIALILMSAPLSASAAQKRPPQCNLGYTDKITGYAAFATRVADSIAGADRDKVSRLGLMKEALAHAGPLRFREILDSVSGGRSVESVQADVSTSVVRALASDLRNCAAAVSTGGDDALTGLAGDIEAGLRIASQISSAPLPPGVLGSDSLKQRVSLYTERTQALNTQFAVIFADINTDNNARLTANGQPSRNFPPYPKLQWGRWNAELNAAIGRLALDVSRAYAKMVVAEDIITARDLQGALMNYVDGRVSGKNLRRLGYNAILSYASGLVCVSTPGARCTRPRVATK